MRTGKRKRSAERVRREESGKESEKKRWLRVTGRAVARKGRITGSQARSMLPYGGWRGRVERGGEAKGWRGTGKAGDIAKGEPARAAVMGEKIDILIGQNNWNERTNGRS